MTSFSFLGIMTLHYELALMTAFGNKFRFHINFRQKLRHQLRVPSKLTVKNFDLKHHKLMMLLLSMSLNESITSCVFFY